MPISQKSEGDLDPLIYIPLGGLVRPKSAAFPQRITLNGRYVALRPLQASHIRPLYSSIGGSNNAHLWRYMLSGPYFSLQDFEDAMHKEMQRTDALFWTIFGPPKSQDPDEVQYTLPIGQIALHRIDPSSIPPNIASFRKILADYAHSQIVSSKSAMFSILLPSSARPLQLSAYISLHAMSSMS